jgi:hypothetical protein
VQLNNPRLEGEGFELGVDLKSTVIQGFAFLFIDVISDHFIGDRS